MILQTKDKPVNRITLYTQFNYAFPSYYSKEYDYDIPLTGSAENSHLYFYSQEPGTATVNWGDGQIETFNFRKTTNNTYACAWRSFKTERRKDPDATNLGWLFGKDADTNEPIIPYPNHHYEDDDPDQKRTITMTFSNSIYLTTAHTILMREFPTLELPDLTSINISYPLNIQEIPVSRISKLHQLSSLMFTSLGGKLQHIPDSLFQLKELTSLSWNNGLDLRNIEISNIRKINQLTNLRTLNIRSSYLKYYLKEFNELPNLTQLEIGNGALDPESPFFDEVTHINPKLTTFNWLQSTGGVMGTKEDWGEQASGMGLENLTSLSVGHARKLTLNLPGYLKEMRSLNRFNLAASLPDEEDRMNTFVNNFYEYISTWELITMNSIATDEKRNQFYNLTVRTYAAAYPDYCGIPSGILQAPEGFVQGVSNGTPTTPMEKIYVLTHNYKQTWEIKPATAQAAPFSTPQLAYNQIIDNTMVVGPEGVIYKNEIVTLTNEELEQIEQNRVSY